MRLTISDKYQYFLALDISSDFYNAMTPSGKLDSFLGGYELPSGRYMSTGSSYFRELLYFTGLVYIFDPPWKRHTR